MEISRKMSETVKVVKSDISIGHAHELMKAHLIHHLPIIEDGKLVGIVTDRDITSVNITNQNDPVSRIMSQPVLTVEQNANLLEALNLMLDKKVSSLVVTSNNEPRGIITKTDLLFLLRDLLREENTNFTDKAQELLVRTHLDKVAVFLGNIGI